MKYDVFISHASQDKTNVARPLAERLRESGLQVWLDEDELRLGDSLRRSIDVGLADSRFGIVILSPDFFSNEWPQRELDGLVSTENGHERVILPVLHKFTLDQLREKSPLLADKLSASTDEGIDVVAKKIVDSINRGRTRKELISPKRKPQAYNESTFRRMLRPEFLFIAVFLFGILLSNDWFRMIDNGWYIETYNDYGGLYEDEDEIKDALITVFSGRGHSLLQVRENDEWLDAGDTPSQDNLNALFCRARYMANVAFFPSDKSLRIRVWVVDRSGADKLTTNEAVIPTNSDNSPSVTEIAATVEQLVFSAIDLR